MTLSLAGLPSDSCLSCLKNYVNDLQCQADKIRAVFLLITGRIDEGSILEQRRAILAPPWKVLPGAEATATGLLAELLGEIDRLPQLVVGLVQGACSATATALLTSCDLIVATADTKLGLGQDIVSRSQVLPLVLKRLGPVAAQHLLVAGGEVGADAAGRLGLLAETVPAAPELLEKRRQLLAEFSRCSPTSLPYVKRLLSDRRGLLTSTLLPFGTSQMPTSFMPSREVLFTDRERIMLHRERKTQRVPPSDPAPGGRLAAAGAARAPQAPPPAKLVGGQNVPTNTTDAPVTTLMICNIPCRITQPEFAEAVDVSGFRDKYDFLYLPTGGRASTGKSSNLGYGFINFMDPADARDFSEAFACYHFQGTSSSKVCTVRPARLQGLERNISNIRPDAMKLGYCVPYIRTPLGTAGA